MAIKRPAISAESIAAYAFPKFRSRTFPEAEPKGGGFRRLLFHGESGRMEDAVESAENRAREIIETARAKAGEIERQARADGFAEGERQGKAAAAERFETLLDAFEKAVTDLTRYRETIYREAETEVATLAMALAEKVVGETLAATREALRHVVHSALAHTVDRQELVIRVDPADYDWIRDEFSRVMAAAWNESVTFEPDPGIGAGGCIIESRFGIVDARISQQLDALESALRKSIGQQDE